MLQRQLSLELDGSARKGTRSLGLLTVSLVFRPMDCVSKAGTCVCVRLLVT